MPHATPTDPPAIASPMPTGSGAIVVHRRLERYIPGYRVEPYDPRWSMFPPAMRRLRPTAARLVHTAVDHAALLTPPGVPLVATFHNYMLDPFMRGYSTMAQRLHYATDLRWLTRQGARRATVVTAVSDFTAELVRSDLGFRDEIRVIPNGVDPVLFAPPPSREGREHVAVWVVGNPTRRKGHHWLGAIAERLAPGVTIWCTSDSVPPHPRIRAAAPRPHAEMPALYGSADIVLLPGVREGLCLAALEAMASGLPVVASDCSSMPELVVEGQGGHLCPIGDTRSFAQRINALAAAPSDRERMGRFNRARVLAGFTEDRMVTAYRALFAEIAGRS